MLITLFCQSVAEVSSTDVAPLGAVSNRFNDLIIIIIIIIDCLVGLMISMSDN